MSDITVNFTYKVPNGKNNPNFDDFSIESWTYTGPKRLWVFINKETLTLEPLSYLTEETNGETYNPLPTLLKIEVDAVNDPLLATIVAQPLTDSLRSKVRTKSVLLPDGRTIVEDINCPPQDIYTYDGITYIPGSHSWSYKWVTTPITWDDIKTARNKMLTASDARVKFDIPDAIKQPWIEYRQLLRDMPTVWADYEAWQVRIPTIATSNTSR
jgi:hypothetical protein